MNEIEVIEKNKGLWSSQSFQYHKKAVASLRYSYDGQNFASAGADGLCIIGDNSGSMITILKEDSPKDDASVLGLSDCSWFHSSRNHILTSSDDSTIKVWDVSMTKILVSMKESTRAPIICVDINYFNSLIVAGGLNGTISIFDMNQKKSITSILGHAECVSSVQWRSNGIDIVSTGNDGVLRVWDSRFLSCCKFTMGSLTNPPICFAKFSANQRYLLISTLNSTHGFFEWGEDDRPSLLAEYKGHLNNKYSIQSGFCILNDKNCIVSGSEDGQVYVWDIATKQCEVIAYEDGSDVAGVIVHTVTARPSDDSSDSNIQFISGDSKGRVALFSHTN